MSDLRRRLEKLEQRGPEPGTVECWLCDEARGMVTRHDGRAMTTAAFDALYPDALAATFHITHPDRDRDLLDDDEGILPRVPGD